MCYALLLSTTSRDDLSQFNSDGLSFENTIPNRLSLSNLLYPHRWYVRSRSGCSCSFRHLYGPQFEFGVPEDWFPEEQADIDATLLFIRVVRALLLKGERVDCSDLWEGQREEMHLISMPVNLTQIRDDEFWLFENHHIDFVTG